jgi:hypothetical protein
MSTPPIVTPPPKIAIPNELVVEIKKNLRTGQISVTSPDNRPLTVSMLAEAILVLCRPPTKPPAQESRREQ